MEIKHDFATLRKKKKKPGRFQTGKKEIGSSQRQPGSEAENNRVARFKCFQDEEPPARVQIIRVINRFHYRQSWKALIKSPSDNKSGFRG